MIGNKLDFSKLKGKAVLIYGAGRTYCRSVIYKLEKEGANIIGIAVTCMQGNPNELDGYKVQEFEQWYEYAGKAVVFITTTRDQEMIKENCISHGFSEVIVPTPDLLEQEYVRPFIAQKILEKGIDVNAEVLKIGNGSYFNLFAKQETGCPVYGEELFDLIMPALFGDYSMIHEGPYELGEVKVEAGDVVFDLGSNLGVFSVYAVSKGAQAYAFEPTPELGQIIQNQSKLNGNHIHLMPYAVSNRCGEAKFYLDSTSCTCNSLDANHPSGGIEVLVKEITLDEFVKQNKLQRVDFIKADIEGAERLMLEGAQEILWNFAPKLALCTYHLPDDPEVMTDLILKANPKYKIEHRWKKLYAHI